MTRVYIATSRPAEIGTRCKKWAARNLPEGFTLTEDLNECEVFISVLYDQLVTEQYASARRCYNFHPGILPSYRGSGVYSWVLLNKEKETGVTLHKIDRNIDSGPIIALRTILIRESDTAESLFLRSMEVLYNLFQEYFCRLLLGQYISRRNKGGKLYLRKDLEKAKDITRFIKAFSFSGKEPLFWIDSSGRKQHIDIEWS